MKKIALLTSTRADYGILKPLILKIHKAKWCNFELLVTGSHLANEFGNTINEIKNDGFNCDNKFDILMASDTPDSVCKSSALATIALSNYFNNSNLDLIIMLGDRYEILAAAISALIHNVPIAHIHGGESTEGLIDEGIRHAVTKLSHIHFVSNTKYAKRVNQMGENPRYIHNVGALGIENVLNHKVSSRYNLEKSLGTKFAKTNVMITYHPLTLRSKPDIKPLKHAIDYLLLQTDSKLFISFPNADTFGMTIINYLKEIENKFKDRIFLTESFGQKNYFDLLNYVDCVVGNSSSGIIEVPYFNKPTVNIGNRQKGRIAPKSVITSNETKQSIESAIKKCLSKSFSSNKNIFKERIYGNGNTSDKILKEIRSFLNTPLYLKKFHDFK